MASWFDDNAPQVNPDGSVELPEPGDPGYVAPGSAPAQAPYTPPNGNTGINGGMDPSNWGGAPLQPAGPANVGHDGSYNGQNREQWRDAWMGQGQMTPQQADQWLAANGARQVNGKNGTWITPHGEQLDLQGGRAGALERGGMIKPIWGGAGDGGGGGASQAPVSAPPSGGSLSLPPAGTGWGAPLAGPPLGPPPAAFVAPTAEDMAQDPGYQTRLKQGAQALLQTRAAQGVLRGGGTAKALTDYNQGMASQEYGNVYNRRMGENQNAFGQWQGTGNMALGFGGLDVNRQQTANAFTLGQGNLDLGRTQAANSYALGQGNLGLGWAGQNTAAQQQDWYQRYGFPIGLGASAANNAANNAGGFGTNSGNNANGIGTAQANGTQAAGNAWGAGAQGVGNAIGGAAGYWADPNGYYDRYGR